MAAKHHYHIIAIVACQFMLNAQQIWSQNLYPATGDAHIHGLTIGTGNGNQVSNTALGDSALFYNKAGINNTAAGKQALFHNSSGQDNTALGYQALYNNFSGGFNLALGEALFSNYSGSYNVALGQSTLSYNTVGYYNTAVGEEAQLSNATGSGNTSVGSGSMFLNTSGNYNTAIGEQSLLNDSTDNYITVLGSEANVGFPNNLSNATAVGNQSYTTASNSVFFGPYGGSVGGYASWTNFSDGRYKRNINRNVPGLLFINQLDPVTYTLDVFGIESRLHANKEPIKGHDGRSLPDPMANPAMQEQSQVVHTGFIAQDVEKTARKLNWNFSGVDKPKDDQQSFYGLRYSDFVVPLVKAFQELSAENDSLKAANARLSLQLDQIEGLLGIGPKPTLQK